MATRSSAAQSELREIQDDCLVVKYHHKKRALHRHNGIEMIYVLKGSATHLIHTDDKHEQKATLKKDNYLILDFGASHAFSNCSSDFLIINFLFRPEIIHPKLASARNLETVIQHPLIGFDYASLRESPVNRPFDDEDKKVLSLFEKAHSAFSKNIPGSTALLRCYAVEVLVLTMQKLLINTPIRKNFDSTIASICSYVDEHYKENVSLTELCREKYFSLPYISKKFKRVCGISFEQYLQQVRIQHACTLLLETDITIEAVANHVSYSDVASFRRTFKRATGKSPLEFRKAFTK